MLNIGVINEGIVIDHIEAGGAMKIYSYLNLEELDYSVAIIKNAKSSKMGKKDIIKIDGFIDIDLDILGVLDRNITINIIKNGVKVEKRNLNLPNQVSNITSIEQDIPHVFKLTDTTKGIYRCIYCEQAFKSNNM